jgi:tetratricopeptide (TPR) repeat protein
MSAPVKPLNECFAHYEAARVRACWNVPFRRNQRFVGRKSLLKRLEETLFDTGAFAKTAIVGLGGIGKTQIALELAHRTKDRWPDCSVLWVPAISLDTIRKAYLEIGKLLQVPGLEEDTADIFDLVRQRLSGEATGRWLFILDNADDFDMLLSPKTEPGRPTRLADCLPQSAHGSVLITTRSKKVAVRMAVDNIIGVSEMDEETATELLRKSMFGRNSSDDDDVAVELLKELTFLPLAIVQAAAYINENSISLAQYRALLKDAEETTAELLSEDFEDEGRYRDANNPIAKTWLVSFEQIRRHNQLAADYLSFMSCLEPRMIPQSLLPDAQSRKKMLEAIGTLTAYSFISTESDGQFYNIHRLVHLATRNWLKEEGLLRDCTGKVLARLTEVFPHHDESNRYRWRTYLPHALYILACTVSELGGEYKVTLQKGCGLCLHSEGRYTEAEGLLKQAMETHKRMLGQEHPDTLSSMNNLALTYRKQGRWKEAEVQFTQVLETKKRVLGEEHPSTLTSMASLALTLWNLGRSKDAEELFGHVLEIRKKAMGPEHPDTLISMSNLATTYWNQGRWKEAEEMEVQVLETSKRVLGQEHPDTLTSMANLASTYKEQGRWKEAEDLDLQAVEGRKRVMGLEHPSTLASMATLASTYKNLRRWQEAEELEVQVVEVRKRVFGQEDPGTLTSMNNLASTYRNQRRWKEAEELAVQVMETRKRVLGHEHPDTLTSMSNLALTFWYQKQWKEAAEQNVQVMETRKKVLGLEHPDTLISMANLASTYMHQGRLIEAEELSVQVLGKRKSVLGLEHPDTLTSMANLAWAWRSLGHNVRALLMMRNCYELRRNKLGGSHPDTVATLRFLNEWGWDSQ